MKLARTLICTAALLAAALFGGSPVSHAALMELTDSVKASFDKTAATAPVKEKEEMNRQYARLSSLQRQDTELEAKTKELRRKNTENEKLLRKQITAIDANLVDKLQKEVTAVKTKHEPLFKEYTALNQRIKAIKPLKNKELNAVLNLKADMMKAAVNVARQNIRSKEAALKAAKDNKNRTMKNIRGTLAEADPLESQIKAAKSIISATKKNVSTEWKNFKYHLKNKDARNAAKSLATLIALSEKIVAQKQKIVNLGLAERFLTNQ